VLRKAGIRVVNQEVCDNGKLTVFTITPRYDPRTETGEYYNQVYARLAEASGWRPLALVDVSDGVLIVLNNKKAARSVDVEYENLR
jgi:hypothetical protein